ncbi:MAG: penicillin-binding protein 2 [Ruminococcaceae bacterium]|nr:penicillin-binding protein 2 [Oscillospiraceae bacterium]MBR3595843.1 penicillin-binding protein 2 [Clostridia bacterium]
MKRNKSTIVKRAHILFISVIFILGMLSFRILMIQGDTLVDVAEIQSTKSVTLAVSRGYIYDRNGNPLVNTVKTDKSVVLSNNMTTNTIKNLFSSEAAKDGIFIKTGTIAEKDSDYIKNFYELKRYSDNQLCKHIIGYTDSTGYGVCGIEKAFDRILDEAKGSLKVSFKTNAQGNALVGNGFEIFNDNYDSSAGISLTIDKDIQRITEEAMKNSDITCGAAVVIDVETGGILASVSLPEYDIENLGEYLNKENQPFLNRALNAYPVGSVIKPFIAAAALEEGFNLFSVYECKGYYNTGGNVFKCYNSNKHGTEDLNTAIQNSCNTYFINIGISAGKEQIIRTLDLFGFGKEIQLCTTLIASSGNLPTSEEITSDSQLANLCFGQGELTVTPIQLAAAYSALARNGEYKEPYLLNELYDNNKQIYGYYKTENKYTSVSEKTCDIINTSLYNNMLNGTGSSACPENVTAAGKTATAQTGRYDANGNEILCTWFAGFFPYEDPQYTLVIFNEYGSSASEDCGPVFKQIAEKITKNSKQ